MRVQPTSKRPIARHNFRQMVYSNKADALTFSGLANFSTIVMVGFLAARSMSLT